MCVFNEMSAIKNPGRSVTAVCEAEDGWLGEAAEVTFCKFMLQPD